MMNNPLNSNTQLKRLDFEPNYDVRFNNFGISTNKLELVDNC